MMGPEDRRRTAYHEAGHAVVGMLTEGADPVRKISIIPRGLSLGVTFSAPEADRYNYQRRELLAKIKVALGGRAAEEIVFAEPTTGAESDIQQLTQIARQMVGRWGMSSAVGPLAVIPADGAGPFLPGASEVSEHTQQLIDDEARRMVEDTGIRARRYTQSGAAGELAQLRLRLRTSIDSTHRALSAGAASDAVAILRRLLTIPAGETVSIARLKIDPVWDRIRNDPGFQRLLTMKEHIGP